MWDNEVLKQKVFQLVLAQYHLNVVERLGSTDDWVQTENNQDIIKLLEPIHNVVHNHRHMRSNKEPWSWVLGPGGVVSVSVSELLPHLSEGDRVIG
jgi:hypothetical protein